MPFPFLPLGALFALTILLATLVAFGLAARALDRTVTEIGTSILPGLVAGVEAWGSRGDPRPRPSSRAARQPEPPEDRPALRDGASIEELPSASSVTTTRVRSRHD